MFSFLRRLNVWICLLLLTVSSAPGLAQAPRQMSMTRPWVQVKATGADGSVTYRIGGVFAEPDNADQRLSVTFICQPGAKLSFFMIHKRSPRQTGKAAKISLRIDAQAPRDFEATRDLGQGLASYSVASSPAVVPLMQAMAGGDKLGIQLDEHGYELPLTGFKAEYSDLQKACLH